MPEVLGLISHTHYKKRKRKKRKRKKEGRGRRRRRRKKSFSKKRLEENIRKEVKKIFAFYSDKFETIYLEINKKHLPEACLQLLFRFLAPVNTLVFSSPTFGKPWFCEQSSQHHQGLCKRFWYCTMLTKVNPPRRPQFCTIEIFYSPELDGCLVLFTVIPRKFLPSSLLVSRRPLGSWHSPPSGHGKQFPDYISAKVPLKDPLRF